MSSAIYRFSLDAVKTTGLVTFILIAVWLTVIGCALVSLRTQRFSTRQRMFWAALIVGVPVFGLLSYLPFSFRKENYPGLFPEKKSK